MNSVKSHIAEQVYTQTNLTHEQYNTMYQQSIDSPEAFWTAQASQFITWFKPWTQTLTGDFNTGNVSWFNNATLNACFNCVDRHLEHRSNQIALLWEGNTPQHTQSLTYGQLHEKISQFANVLKGRGVKKGDRVCIYLPMIPEAAIAMLACARIGAIHSVVFGGFSADALKKRILDADCHVVITANEGVRGDKIIPLKKNCDDALHDCPDVHTLIVIQHTPNLISWQPTRDVWYHDAMRSADKYCPIEHMDANEPLFILYTSGSTGNPKGVVHNTGGYMVYAAMTHHYIFDYQAHDIYWCTADIGWITGHTYLIYGPLANGATTLMFEGVPNYPDYSRFWSIIDKYQVSIFYTSPTALRALRREGDTWVTKTKRHSLRRLGSVGEPINPDVWEWYYHVVGERRCPIVNTWWQTETGGIMLTPLPDITALSPGSVGVPFFGIAPSIVDIQGNPQPNNTPGLLVITQPWPGLMRTIYGDHARFVSAYFNPIPGNYVTGDGGYQDKQGEYWIIGREDDIIKVSGHRIGTEELESAFISHDCVAEAAVVGVPHEIKGESIFAFVTLKSNVMPTEGLKKELVCHVRDKIGPLATPETVQWADALPKTRSGKIMRRILRKIAMGDHDNLGDTSTLADAEVITRLIENRIKNKEEK